MAFKITGEHIDSYHRNGYCIFRRLIPATLLTELRKMADAGRPIARERGGPQAQRLQPIADHLDIKPYLELAQLPELNDAIEKLFGPGFYYGIPPFGDQKSRAGILYEPAERPYCTMWHRDWRDNIPGMSVKQWEERMLDLRLFNQVNCALYEDNCTWIVPGSHLRRDLPAEVERFPMRPVPGPDLADTTAEEAEYRCLAYCESLPGAMRAELDAGDFMLYRNSLWHLGNYVPYKMRATLHDGVWTEAFFDWFTNWPKREDGVKEFVNPNVDTPEYQTWKEEHDAKLAASSA